MQTSIDTHEYIKKLIEAGFTEKQAESVVKISKEYNAEVFKTFATKIEISNVLKDSINETKQAELRLEKSIEALKSVIAKWFVSAIILIPSLQVAITKFF